jgi:hypothetical protein
MKDIYTPKDRTNKDYDQSVADAGKYPFTRGGIHPNMFRGRYWTRREVIGIVSHADTHERLKVLTERRDPFSSLKLQWDVTLSEMLAKLWNEASCPVPWRTAPLIKEKLIQVICGRPWPASPLP